MKWDLFIAYMYQANCLYFTKNKKHITLGEFDEYERIISIIINKMKELENE